MMRKNLSSVLVVIVGVIVVVGLVAFAPRPPVRGEYSDLLEEIRQEVTYIKRNTGHFAVDMEIGKRHIYILWSDGSMTKKAALP